MASMLCSSSPQFPHPLSMIWLNDLFSPIESDRNDIEQTLRLDHDDSTLVSWNPEISM